MTEYKTFDLTVKASDALILKQDFSDGKEPEPQDKLLRRRILAVSEGTWNGTFVSAEELQAMVERACQHKEKDSRTYFAVPIVVDHSERFLDKVGGTFGLNFGDVDTVAGKRPGAIADVEFWEDTPMQQEVAARVRRDPENTYFSVRFRGMLNYNGETDEFAWSDMWLVHIAIVNEPADPNTGILEELSKKAKSDFSLNVLPENQTGMTEISDLEKRLDALEQENSDLKAWKQKAEQAELAAKQKTEQEDLHARSLVIAELMALDKDYDKELIGSMSLEQLEKYKANLERLFPKEIIEKGSAEGSTSESAEDLAKKYYME